MTTAINVVAYDASLADVAEALDSHRIRQLPVMRDGSMIGIISRADIVRALAQSSRSTAGLTNGELRRALWQEIRRQSWLRSTYLNLSVKDGVVELYGAVQSQDQRRALLVMIKGVTGVQQVVDNLSVLPQVVTV